MKIKVERLLVEDLETMMKEWDAHGHAVGCPSNLITAKADPDSYCECGLEFAREVLKKGWLYD